MVNLYDTWDGELLTDVRSFIQTQLKKGFVSVSQSTANGKIILTFSKADGTTETVSFTAAEGAEGEGYQSSFYINKRQSVYGTGSPITFNYTFNQTLDGSEVTGVIPTITFVVSVYDASTGLPDKELYTITTNSIGTNTVSIPASAFDGIEGNVIVQGSAKTVYGGQEYVINKSIILTIATCKLSFAPGFNLSKQVKGYAATDSLNEVFVTYSGTNDAELLIYIDGVQRGTMTLESGVTAEVTYDMGATDEYGEVILSTGMHTMQLFAKMDTGTVDEQGQILYIYSGSLLFDFYKGITGNHIGIQLVIDSADVIKSPIDSLQINSEQYVNTVIQYAASSYDNSTDSYAESTAVSVTKNTTLVSNLAVGNGEVFDYTFRDIEISKYALKFSVTANSRKINVVVVKNSSGVTVASGASIDITAAGRNNMENTSTVNLWSFKDNTGASYTGTLSNFTFKSSGGVTIDGWDGEGLVFRGNTQLDIPYKPFASFNAATGYYIEFDFEVNTVLDNDLYILKCFNADNKGGFYIKAEEAGMITANGTVVSTPIAAGTKYNVSFMIKQYEGTNNGQAVKTILLELFVNGVRSGVNVFNTGDSFDASATISANGLGAVWKLYGMRVYNTTLTPVAIYNNYLTTLLDSDEIIRLADENDILNTAKTAVNYEKLLQKGKNVLIVEVGDGDEECVLDNADSLGKLPSDLIGNAIETRKIATKTQFLNPSAVKKDNFLVKGLTYYNNGKLSDPYSFKTGPTLMQVQGTSSTYYSRKNFDIFFTGQKYSKADGDKSPANWTSKFDTSVGQSVQGANTTSPMYSMSSMDQGVPCLCLKADYSDSSNLHNTVLTKLVNDVWMSLGEGYWTPPQHNNDTEYDKVRVGINGHPIDVFVKDGTTYEYIGQYNMNNEKKDSHHVFGFTAGSGNPSVGEAVCLEFLENNRTATLFNAGADFNWETCSDTVDEDGKGIVQLEFRYPGYDWDEAPTDLKNKAKRPFIWVKECYDDWAESYNESTGEYTSSKFVEELTNYFNPKNLVSWYLFTEYFMAVDQRSKNMMMASWDATATSGIWYFLPYDSDTALGVTNDGWLILPWDSDEETPNPKDPTQYAFMGHDSNLWKLVRYYLYDDTYTSNEKYGLKGCSMQEIAQVLRNEKVNDTLFNTYTIDKSLSASRNYWSDLIYNFDADTKYIAPLTYQSGRGSKSDFAQFIQGARDAHRDWLINKRFRMLDGKYAAGYFIADEKNMKMSKEAGVEASMLVTSPTTAYVQLIINTRVVAKQKLLPNQQASLNINDFAVGSNDPFKLQGFSSAESIDFNTLSPYIYSDSTFPATFTNLKQLVMNCPNNDGILAENISNIVSNLPNLRELTIKGYPNATGILDLSNNIMLEKIDILCEGLSNIILPYSIFNLKSANFGNLNEMVPWEFWDELNEYHWRKSKSCIVVGELVEGADNYGFKPHPSRVSYLYYASDRFFVTVLPIGTLYGRGRYSNKIGFFGAAAGQTPERNAQNIKKIFYAKIDYSRRPEWQECDGGYLSHLFANCSNLEYVNTRGWNMKIDTNFTASGYADVYTFGCDGVAINCTKLKNLDMSFLDTTPGYFISGSNQVFAHYYQNKSNGWESFDDPTCVFEYVKYGTKFFMSQIETDWAAFTNNAKPMAIANQSTLNAQTFIDLAEDLPDISGRTFTSTKNNTLNFGSANYNDYVKIPQSVRNKIEAKGWIINV